MKGDNVFYPTEKSGYKEETGKSETSVKGTLCQRNSLKIEGDRGTKDFVVVCEI